MASAQSLETDTQNLRQMLLKWAKHLASTDEGQRKLVEQTIALASNEPNVLPAEPIDRAMLSLMLKIVASDLPMSAFDTVRHDAGAR